MKKIIFTLFVAICCLSMAYAQMLQRNPAANVCFPRAAQAPVMKSLGQYQLYMGPYTSDVLAESGVGLANYSGVFQIATALPLDVVQLYDGGEMKAIRFGLCSSVTDGAVMLFTLTKLNPLTIGDTLVNQSVETTVAGWNQVELETPVTINTEGIAGLLLGFQYKQIKGSTDASFPISAVMEGTVLNTYLNGGSLTGNQWMDVGLASYGNLSVQAIVENENFPDFNLLMGGLQTSVFAKISDGLDYVVNFKNNGILTLENYTIDVLIDDEVEGLIDSPEALTQGGFLYTGHVDLEGLASGLHTLSLRIASVSGEAITDGTTVTTSFIAYNESFPRQKHLVEHFTSTTCSYCPLGVNLLNALDQLCEGNMAWVSIHNNIPSAGDPYVISKGLSLATYLGSNSNPSAVFNRYDAEHSGSLPHGLGYDASTAPIVAQYFHDNYFDGNNTPVMVNLKFEGSTYDEESRELKISVWGDATSDFEAIYGTNVGLTIYLTEDSLVARQNSMGTWLNDYVHDRVLRSMPTAYDGDDVLWTEDKSGYNNEYTVTLNRSWKAEKMHVIALVHRKGAATAKEVINCEMIDIKDLPKPAQTITGDINGDGNVDIADVNAVINMMLGKAEATAAGDVTGDGTVDIADVNAVINIMLGKK
ncbi:MAG: Omp28-related outer membrane protein [Muribaculaceae bacterium]|nr:Omp28-related outer membrane protein [Muribaculaceae bacterium]